MKKIQLDKDIRQKAIDDIKKFFLSERNEEIGDIAATIFLEFIIDDISPIFYNKGVHDCIAVMHDKIEDLYSLEV